MQQPPAQTQQVEARRGFVALLAAYIGWGFLPIYLRALHEVPPVLIIAYRLVLSCAFVLLWLGLRGELSSVRAALTNRQVAIRLLASALLISTNWLTYVWAVSVNRLVEASFGYFINPLLNVLLGVVLLGERLRRLQWVAISLAALGVTYMTVQAGRPPFIALVLALSFGIYGLVRKTIAVDALVGLGAETLLITPLGAAYLAWCELTGRGALALAAPSTLGLLTVSGVLTAMPLWLFSFGARRVTFATVGLVSYVGPTLQLLIGVYLFHEPFDPHRAAGFVCIWCGLVLYSADALFARRARTP